MAGVEHLPGTQIPGVGVPAMSDPCGTHGSEEDM